MKQLTFKDLINLFDELKKDYKVEEILEMPIYIGDDDELNGIHCAWFRQLVNPNSRADKDLVDLINENYCNKTIKKKSILIS